MSPPRTSFHFPMAAWTVPVQAAGVSTDSPFPPALEPVSPSGGFMLEKAYYSTTPRPPSSPAVCSAEHEDPAARSAPPFQAGRIERGALSPPLAHAVTVRRVWRGESRNGLDAAADEDSVAIEEPLEISVSGVPLTLTMRTPGDDVNLALGFLHAEGIVESRAAVGRVV